MPGLNENHKRRLLAAFQYADELLSRSLSAAAPSQPGLYSRCVVDLSPSELHSIENCTEKVREQIRRLQDQFEIPLPSPSTPSSWILKTNLTSLDITLEELYPDRMRSYGEIDPKTANDLTRTLQEVRGLLSQVISFLAER
jgi:hypothetical protein